MKTLRRLNKSKRGVSQVIAVLVLTAVVIVGAIGAGMIMNTFSNQVSKSTSADGIGTGAATEILIAGSTTVQPLTECIAKDYMAKNKGARITVQGGGSDAGIASIGMGVIDIGSASKALDSTIMTKWPTLQAKEVGGSAVVVLVSSACGAPLDATKNVTAADLKALYNGSVNTLNGVLATKYERAEGSGTEETFAKWIGLVGADKNLAATGTTGATGNAGMAAAISSCGTTKCCVGFVDHGFVASATNSMTPRPAGKVPSSANILAELKAQNGVAFVTGLTRPLNYITNGAPSSMEQDFLTFASSPGEQHCFDETGYYAAYAYK